MSEFENTGLPMAQESETEAASLAPENETETGEAFSEFAGTEPTAEENNQQAEAPAKEPGWIKGRVDKAVQRAVRETEERMRAEFEQRLAPFRERMLDEQAENLVKAGEFKSIERAKEYVRLKGGVTLEEPAQAQEAQPAQQVQDPRADERMRILAEQANKLAKRGVDVMGAFRSDERIHDAILSGEMDFYDVAEQIAPRRVPRAVRSANNASAGGLDISRMSESDFQKLQRDLAAGKRYDLRR